MEKVKLGTIVNTRGLKGEVKIMSSTEFSKERYKPGNKIQICIENSDTFLTCKKHSHVGNFDYVMFEEITTLEQAEKLKNIDVFVDTNSLHKLEKDSYYFYQLIGCKVVDENNNEIGVVSEVEDNNAQNYLRVKTGSNDVLVPFVKAFILNVDVDNKIIKIFKMEGLM